MAADFADCGRLSLLSAVASERAFWRERDSANVAVSSRSRVGGGRRTPALLLHCRNGASSRHDQHALRRLQFLAFCQLGHWKQSSGALYLAAGRVVAQCDGHV